MTSILSVHPVGALFLTAAVISATATSQDLAHGPEKLAELIAETPVIQASELSPDGDWIAYLVQRRSVATNTTREQWVVRPVAERDDAEEIALPENATAVRWRPGTQTLSLLLSPEGTDGGGVRFMLFDPGTRSLSAVNQQPLDQAEAQNIVIDEDYRWSPRGRYVAFLAPVSAQAQEGLDPRRGVPASAWINEREPRRGLFVLDVAAAKVTQLTPRPVRLAEGCGFAWSPDERSLAVAIDPVDNSRRTNSDLIVIDRESGKMRDLVVRPGMDCHPLWSPDGSWIAFASQHGKPDYSGGWPALVRVEGGEAIAFTGGNKGIPSRWLNDSSGFLFEIGWRMSRRLVLADLSTRVMSEPLPQPADALNYACELRSYSADGARMAYVRSAPNAPAELFVVDTSPRGHPSGPARPLTALSPAFPLRDKVRVAELSWPSPDGRFSIHGLLLTPAAAWQGDRFAKPLPTLLYLTGGPSMVRKAFGSDGWSDVRLLLAAAGYAVLVPNTRGREGNGDDFLFGIRDAKSNARVPFADAVAGIDDLIRRGIADADRLGILGHSYGGFLTEYGITQTNRFKAAVVHEAHVVDLMAYNYPFEAGTWRALLAADLFGVHDPVDPAERTRLVAESPGLNAERIKTPTLLLFGAHAMADYVGRPFHALLRRHNVPSAFFVYDEGHVFQRPAAIVDDLTRTMEWLDYWVRGKAYPDAERAVQYQQ